MTFTNDGPPPIKRVAGESLRRWVHAPLSALSFWSAVTLPVLYLPLLVSGIETTSGLAVFLGLFGMHVLALIGGHGYHNDST